MSLFRSVKGDEQINTKSAIPNHVREVVDDVNEKLGLEIDELVVQDGKTTDLTFSVNPRSGKRPIVKAALVYDGDEGEFAYRYAKAAYQLWYEVSGFGRTLAPIRDTLHRTFAAVLGDDPEPYVSQVDPARIAAEGWAQSYAGKTDGVHADLDPITEAVQTLDERRSVEDVSKAHEALVAAIKEEAASAERKALDALPDNPKRAAYDKGRRDALQGVLSKHSGGLSEPEQMRSS